MAFPHLAINHLFETGFFREYSGAIMAANYFSVEPMTDQPSTLYAKLLGETAVIGWRELQPFFARGALLWVEPGLDLIVAAEAMALNDEAKVAQWMASGALGKVSESRALDLLERDPELWATVVSPWVMIQERAQP